MTRGIRLLLAIATWPAVGVNAQDPADAAWRAGDVETARRLYGEQLAADSTDERALHRMGLMLAWDKNYGASIRLFDQMLTLSPRNWEAAVDRARVFAWRGRTARAIELLDEVLEQQPTYLPALQARAQFQGWAGEYAAALSTYEQIGEVLPEDRSVSRDRARVLSWASRLDAAIGIYDSLLQIDSTDREALLGLARALAWDNQLDSAATVYRNLLSRDSTDVDALHGVGRALSWRGDLIAGEEYWRRSLAVDSNSVEGLVGLGANLRWQGRPAAAYQIVQRAEQLSPVNRDVLTEMQWLRASIAPRATGSLVYENDTDGNRITSLTARGSWRHRSRFEFGVLAYARGLGLPGPVNVDQRAFGAQLEGSLDVEPGWTFMLGLGVSASDVENSGAAARVSGRVSSPRRGRVVASLGYTHEPLDASALLVQNGVLLDQLTLGLRTMPAGGWVIAVSGSYAVFDGSERNSRWAGYGSATKRLSPRVTLGTSVRTFGFEKNLNDGYFDPDLYVLGEINFRWQHSFGRWYPTIEAAPGLQQVGKEGTVSGAGRARVAIGFRVLPGREFELSGGYSTTGLSIFGADVGNYRYRSVMFLTKWVI